MKNKGLEIEVKVKLDNLHKTKALLSKMGVAWGKTKVLIDHYFRLKEKVREDQGPGSYVLRVRKNKENFLTMKLLTERRGVWEEYETKIEDPETLEKILQKAGFATVCLFHKKRTSGKLGKFSLELDQIEELGDYLEVEIIGKDGEKMQEEIKDFFKKLDLPEENIERRGYPEIVMESQGIKFLGQK